MNQLIIQGIGYIALLFIVLSFQNKKRTTILILMLTGILLFVIHYALLGAWTGSMMNLIEAGVVYVSHQKESKSWAKSNVWLYFFITLFIVAGLVTAENGASYLPTLGQIFGTLAVWQKNPRAIRFLMLIPRPLWFIYNFLVGSYAGMVGEIFIFFSVATGIVRFDVLGNNIKSGKK